MFQVKYPGLKPKLNSDVDEGHFILADLGHTVFNVSRMLVRSTCEKVKNLQKSLSKPIIHNTIDDWIDHRI